MAYGNISRCVRPRGLPSSSCKGVLTVRAQEWEGVFRHYDGNHNDYIDGDELGQALERFGYPLTPQLQNLLKRKYGAGPFEHPISPAHCSRLLNVDVPWHFKDSDAVERGETALAHPAGHSPPPPGISFDRFIRACVVVKQLKKSFDALDRDPNGRVKIKYKDFLRMVFELP